MEETNKVQHLVIKYFDTYPVKEYLFDTEEDAREFEEKENKKVEHFPKTEFMYRGIARS